MPRRLILAVVLACLAARAARGDDPDLVWHTLETDHFVVHYYQPNEDIGRRVATVAERAYMVLTKALAHEPEDKTQIVVTDDTNGANGFANVLPRNVIHVYATAPGATSSLNDHDDWLYGLVAHEFAHIVHLDTISGIPRWYNKIFGKTWAPNQIQPRWFIEGLATYEESKRSSGGRIRSALFDMYLRAAVFTGTHIDLDAMTTGPFGWPHGNAAYLYGSHFLDFVADRHGDDTIRRISHEYGKQPVPFGLNRAASRATGEDYLTLYQEWTEHLRRKYELQRDAVVNKGLVEGKQLTNTGEGNGGVRFLPGGEEIMWVRSDGYSDAQFRAMRLADGRERFVAVIDGEGRFSPLPDGSGFVLHVSVNYRTSYGSDDLFRYEYASKKLTRLTTGARAVDPDVSPDGRTVAFMSNSPSKFRLAIMPLAGGAEPEIVWEGEGRYDQGFYPVWSPDGGRLAFSAWTEGGFHDLYVIDLATREATRLTADRAIDIVPRWDPGGRWLYYASDRNGIYNIYAIDTTTREVKQVTNMLGGTMWFDVSPDGKTIVYVGFEQDGNELYQLDNDPARWLDPEPYVDDRPDPERIPDGSVAIDGPRAYRPLETLAPNVYTLTSSLDTFGSAISAGTSGHDVAGWHAYNLAATYGFTRGDVSFGASYSYGRLWPGLRLAASRGVSRPAGMIVDGHGTRYTEEVWGLTGSMSLPVLRRPALSSDLSLSYDLDWVRKVDGELPQDPNVGVPRAPELGTAAGVSLRWSLSASRRNGYLVGPSGGRTLSLGLRFNHPAAGSDFESVELTWRWQEFWKMPWHREHSLALRVTGGLEETRRRRDGSYSLGGLGDQDLAQAILDSLRAGTSVLHGYPPGSLRGRQFHLASLELRAPLVTIEKGVATLPFYVRRLHAGVFVDAGNASSEAFDPLDLRVAVGGSLRLDVVFGYFAPGTFDLGYARGLSQGGENQFWLLLAQTI